MSDKGENMDPSRLNTSEVLEAGILGKPAPETGEPEGRERASLYIEEVEEDKVAELLDAGKIVDCSEYYGIPIAWRVKEGRYRGILLQYRSVTEERDFVSAAEAAEWFRQTAALVAE